MATKEQQKVEWQLNQLSNMSSSFDSLVRHNFVVRERFEYFDNAEQLKKMVLEQLAHDWSWGRVKVEETDWVPDESELDELSEFMMASVLGGTRLPDLHQVDDSHHPVATFGVKFDGGNLKNPYESDVVIWEKKGGENGIAYLLLAQRHGGVERVSE